MFTIKALCTRGNSDVLADWYAKYPARQWAALWGRYSSIFHYLRAQPQVGWTGNYYHPLRDGVGRIGFTNKSIAHRHLGFFGPATDDFTILLTAQEKNHIYMPKGCIDDAVSLMREVIADPARARLATIQVAPEEDDV